MATRDRSIAEIYADKGLDGDYGDHEMRMRQIAYAQVHATLALADAVADAVDTLTRYFEEHGR